MIGGGKWTKENKTLPGSYSNFMSGKKDKPDKKKDDTSSVLGVAVLGKMILST